MTTQSPALTAQEQWIKEAVDRFLQWPLPESVYPDAGKFDAANNRWRSGTNLLSADEARQMLEYVCFADDAHFGEISDHLFVEQRGDGIWLVCVEKVHESMESAQQSCRRWKANGRTADWTPKLVHPSLTATPAVQPIPLMSDERISAIAILQAVARGWCHKKNANKPMDIDLATSISSEIGALLAEAQKRGEGWTR